MAIRKTILDLDADLVLSLPSNLTLLLQKYTTGRAINVNVNDSQYSFISQYTAVNHLMPADDEEIGNFIRTVQTFRPVDLLKYMESQAQAHKDDAAYTEFSSFTDYFKCVFKGEFVKE